MYTTLELAQAQAAELRREAALARSEASTLTRVVRRMTRRHG